MNPLIKTIKAVKYLGFRKLWLYMLYQVGLYSGHFRRLTPSKMSIFSGEPSLPPYKTFPHINKTHREQLLSEADQIRNGFIHLFGDHQVQLDLNTGASKDHWSELEKKPVKKDIKFIWEPGRFSWAITLARAYAVSGDDLYAQDFWKKTLAFLEIHPPNKGRQWQSAQEVAIRLMVFVFCDRVFASAPSSTPENRRRLWQSIIEHAQRIPPTLVYARAQNNNHLLSEAAGLFTAGVYLSGYSQAKKWRQSGWRWINWAIQNQVDEFGTYVQHSVNYHRLMLQVALYADQFRRLSQETWPPATFEKLKAAATWLWSLTDPKSGLTPNMGANDSAYIFPFTQLRLEDYRPSVDAAAKAFLKTDVYQQTDLAEMADWFEIPQTEPLSGKQPHAPDMLRLSQKNGRAFIRAAHFTDRPSHADQLHVDIWWKGVNVAQDPGTYQYNALPPWNNALATTQVHNTLSLDGHDQMSRAGRFLWLDWAQAEILAHEIDDVGQIIRVTAEHDGYRRIGAQHQRTLKSINQGWQIEDSILAADKARKQIYQACISWLLPDWEWQVETGNQIRLTGPIFSFTLQIEGVLKLNLFRSGKRLLGDMPADPTWGWVSKAYGDRRPAVMVKAQVTGLLPLILTSTFKFK